MDTVDFDARYTVDYMSGVAVYATRYGTTEEYEGDYLACGDDECDHMLSETCWVEGEWSIVTDTDWVYVVMVGDDEERLTEVSSLVKISDDDYCHGCGQVGCGVGT